MDTTTMNPNQIELEEHEKIILSENPSEKSPESNNQTNDPSLTNSFPRTGFTSENFKIEVNGLPKFFGIGESKKLFRKLGLKAHKFKPVGGKNARYMFVNFSDEEEKLRAIKVLDGLKLKGSYLKAFSANAAKDPLIKQRENDCAAKKQDISETALNTNIDKSAADRIAEAVCPLWVSYPAYEDQLEQKLKGVKVLMNTLRKEYFKQLPILSTTKQPDLLGSDAVAKVGTIVPSPVVNGYRNKCEFSIGNHHESQECRPIVGFRLSSYKKGSIAVAEMYHLPQVSDKMKGVVKHFQEFIQKGEGGWILQPYEQITQQGYWRQLTVRSSRNGNLMVLVILHPQLLTGEEKDRIRSTIINSFDKLKNSTLEVSSLHIQFLGQKGKGTEDPPIELLSGSECISETLMDGQLAFKISPQSFFQVNVEAAENLYNVCADLAGINDGSKEPLLELSEPKLSILFDVCCGTGTIGLCLANRCHKVIGVDCVPEAVANAKENAKRNGVLNAEFHTGRAEFLLPELLKKETEDNQSRRVVAIVDPPRAGLHPKAITALRAAKEIQTLVYVSCDAKAAMQSLISLGRPPSNTFKGDPFVPRRIVPVDLFPHTSHVEVVIEFKRMPLIQMANKY